ncbi:transcriptional regulator, AraC family [Paenibacillus curdlanolyticus YK9]|uniref:Transcriptional regulator, AraC family n=1 Tax=Paenibacillus curdlanolyticus YK9 TaxID=717606 RepID=E0I834_9BACL|nr:AraC family transcriptional regulator [Paenibacillus curdlanolyticus]EFM11339.1 transcriptional regulator, AraC family [Paenibacillus curdlanolyticus YK9]
MLELLDVSLDRGMNWYGQCDDTDGVYTLVLVSYGKCVYWINADKLILEKGDVLLIPPRAAFYGKSVPTVFHEKLVARFKAAPAIVRDLPLLARQDAVQGRPGRFEWMLERLRVLHAERADRTPYAEIRGAAIITELAALWNRELDQAPMASGTHKLVERMKQHIQLNYRDKVTKEELGACINRTPNYAASLFRRATGQTISEAVNAARMKTAIYMLTDSLLTVNEISDYLGYRDVSYFQRVFKRTTGRTPSSFLR